MKKNLRMLCMGLATAVCTASFAQTDVTGKLLNADMERGMLGWDVEFINHIWQKTTKSQTQTPGYHGADGICLEVWKADGAPVTASSISQTLKGLENGTYVFGAYMLATNSEVEENRESIYGVSIFAGDQATPVATNRVESMNVKWGHTAKFNVAATVTDGTLTVGVKVDEDNTVNFILMDNATLYYFGDKTLETALDEMAKIDIAATIALADTCLTHKMNVDTLAYLKGAIAAGKELAKAEEAYQADEDIYWGMRLAKKSIASYSKLTTALASAKVVRDMQWSDYANTVAALNALKELIDEADVMYKEATAINTDVDTMAMNLDEASALLQLDSCYILAEEYDEICDDLPTSGEPGEYTEAMQDQIENILVEVLDVLTAVEEGLKNAVEAKSYCEAKFAQIQSILNNPVAFAEFPIVISREETVELNGYKLMKGATLTEGGYPTFTSPLYRFDEPLTRIRFTIKENGGNRLCGNYPFTSLATFAMYDENGDQIEITEEDVVSNAGHNDLNSGNDGQGIPGMLDDDPTTYFHTTWGTAVNEYHYIEVTLPEDQEYTAFSFTMTARPSADLTFQFPAVLDIRYVSDIITDLQTLVKEVDGMAPVQGTSVGFYNTDVNVYYEAIEEAKALIEADYADEDDVEAAIENLTAAVETLNASFILPDPEKQYRVVSAVAFIDHQGVQKALTSHIDGNGLNRLYWETADPDSVNQVFAFEPISTEDGNYLYNMKQVNTGLYVGTYVKPDSTVEASAFALTEEAGEVTITPYGEGRFTIGQGPLAGYHGDVNTMHANGHGTGSGESNTVIKWNVENAGTSWWYIREMTTLPATVKSISDELFKSTDLFLYSKVNQLVLTADKECAFDDLKIYDKVGAEQTYTAVKNGATATIVLDAAIASFSFSFANAEGVTSVKVKGSLAAKADVTDLQKAYDDAVAVAPVEGNDVGQVSDLKAYNAAIAAAEEILLLGGSDELIEKTTKALKDAVAGLVYNYPVADKTYYILSAIDFAANFGTDMSIHVSGEKLMWSYVSLSKPTHLWRFVDCGKLVEGMPAYYLQNVGTELYISPCVATGSDLFMVEDTTETQPYNVLMLKDGKVSIGDSRYPNGNASLHPKGHSTGSGRSGSVILWGNTDASTPMRIVESERYISDLFLELDIEDIEIAGEQVAPAVKGTFDLYGRRIEAPAATGIYIVDGKKRVIKK